MGRSAKALEELSLLRITKCFFSVPRKEEIVDCKLNGFGKCTGWLNFPKGKRGQGVIAMQPAREMRPLERCRSSGLTKLCLVT